MYSLPCWNRPIFICPITFSEHPVFFSLSPMVLFYDWSVLVFINAFTCAFPSIGLIEWYQCTLGISHHFWTQRSCSAYLGKQQKTGLKQTGTHSCVRFLNTKWFEVSGGRWTMTTILMRPSDVPNWSYHNLEICSDSWFRNITHFLRIFENNNLLEFLKFWTQAVRIGPSRIVLSFR